MSRGGRDPILWERLAYLQPHDVNRAGITELIVMRTEAEVTDPAMAYDATNANTLETPVAIGSAWVVVLDDTLKHSMPQLDLVNNTYVALGVGDECELVGKLYAETPTHMPAVGTTLDTYCHNVAVYEIPSAAGQPAQYVGMATACKTFGGIVGHIYKYNEARDRI